MGVYPISYRPTVHTTLVSCDMCESWSIIQRLPPQNNLHWCLESKAISTLKINSKGSIKDHLYLTKLTVLIKGPPLPDYAGVLAMGVLWSLYAIMYAGPLFTWILLFSTDFHSISGSESDQMNKMSSTEEGLSLLITEMVEDLQKSPIYSQLQKAARVSCVPFKMYYYFRTYIAPISFLFSAIFCISCDFVTYWWFYSQ
jgi:hypothetical protein